MSCPGSAWARRRSAASSPTSATRRRAQRSTPPGRSASASSTPRRCTGPASRSRGAALAGRPRDELILSTKVGRLLVPGEPDPHFANPPALKPVFDFSPAAVHRSLTESLERLQQDRVDIALLHDPDDHLDEARRAIDAARELVPTVGVGTNVV